MEEPTDPAEHRDWFHDQHNSPYLCVTDAEWEQKYPEMAKDLKTKKNKQFNSDLEIPF